MLILLQKARFPKVMILFFALLVVLALSGAALAQSNSPAEPQPLTLTDTRAEYNLGLYLALLVDPGGQLTIDQVSSPEYFSKFVPSKSETPNFAFTDSAIWARLTLNNEALQSSDWVLEQGFSNMQFVDLYTPNSDGNGYSVRQTGVLRSNSTRDIQSPNIAFNLHIPNGSQQTYYLRFESGASMTLPLTLWTQAAFLQHSLETQILKGLYFGVMIGLLFYNLFLLFSLREASYLYFVLALASLIIEELVYDGFWALYISNVLPQTKFIMQWAFSLMIAFMVLFADSFLEVKRQIPALHRLDLAIVALWAGIVLVSPFVSYHIIASLSAPLAIISLILVCIAGIITWRKGFRPARYFLIAWLGLLLGIIWVILVRLDLLPSTLISENAYRFAILWMVVCWSIALIDRINLLKAETETANRRLSSSEYRLSQILDGLPLGVVVYGNDHKPNYVNQSAQDILSNPTLGIRPDISAGRTLEGAIDYFSLRVAGSGLPYPMENFPINSALEGEPAFADDIEADLGDKIVPLEVLASPIRDKAGNVEAAVVAFQDIYQRKANEAELVEYRKHLEHLVEKRTEELSAINEQLTNEMSERKILELSLHQRIVWLSAVNKAHQTMGGVSGLFSAYQELSAVILQLLNASHVFVVRWGESDDYEVYSFSQNGDHKAEEDGLTALFDEGSLLRGEIAQGATITWRADQAGSLLLPLREYFDQHGIQSAILAPMVARQSILGSLCVAATNSWQLPSGLESDLVERMALDLADLAQDAVLLDQALTLAALEERHRLARDLHDSVTQVLFSASLLAEVLPQVWRRDPEQGFERLDRLRRLTRGALAEMRTMLLELRPSAVINTPLNDLLVQLAEAVTSRSGIEFHLQIEKIPALPVEVHISFYRIAQEALNNVVKHAQASQVTMSLRCTPLTEEPHAAGGDEIRLEIQDDGVGFSPEKRRAGQLGIGIMFERAAAVGAQLALESHPGYGTQVTLIWNIEDRDS